MRITLVILLAYAVIQANAEQPDDPANPTTTDAAATTAPLLLWVARELQHL
ncbi:hypothetical protein V3C99_008788 [Haemonchus contortus]